LNSESIRKLFADVRRGKLTPDDAVARLRHLPFEDLGFAKIDHHRALRVGMPEVIFGERKSPAQVAAIFSKLAKHGGNVLATHADEKQYAAVKKKVRGVQYRELARAIALERDRQTYGKGIITVVSAGTSDIAVAEEAVVTAELMGNEVQHLYDVGVAGVHRLLANREKRAAQCGGWPGGRARNRRPDQRGLRCFLQGTGGLARHDELLRVERKRGEHRQWLRRRLRRLPHQPPVNPKI
jgi:NCAIR mutase (PurE)-related protein